MTLQESITDLCGDVDERVNERGNKVLSGHTLAHWEGDDNRYRFDSALLPKGWEQYDTDQDAWYFGVWVHLKQRAVFTYAEGDAILVLCDDDARLRAELAHMADFYGEAPPAFRCIHQDGSVSHVYDERPKVSA